MYGSCDAHERDQALVEQLRQQQVELAKAPVIEIQALIPEAAAAPTPTPAAQPEPDETVLAPSLPEEIAPLVTDEEGGELSIGGGSGGAEVETAETKTRTDEIAADAQSVASSVQDAGQDSEESRKRRDSMRSNAEQVC